MGPYTAGIGIEELIHEFTGLEKALIMVCTTNQICPVINGVGEAFGKLAHRDGT